MPRRACDRSSRAGARRAGARARAANWCGTAARPSPRPGGVGVAPRPRDRLYAPAHRDRREPTRRLVSRGYRRSGTRAPQRAVVAERGRDAMPRTGAVARQAVLGHAARDVGVVVMHADHAAGRRRGPLWASWVDRYSAVESAASTCGRCRNRRDRPKVLAIGVERVGSSSRLVLRRDRRPSGSRAEHR